MQNKYKSGDRVRFYHPINRGGEPATRQVVVGTVTGEKFNGGRGGFYVIDVGGDRDYIVADTNILGLL